MDGRSLLLLALFAWPCAGWAVEGDPVTSVMWDYHHARLLDGAPFVFDEQVRVVVPPFAEDARQVPILVDASAYQGQVVRILAWAELNPIAQIFDFAPGAEVLPRLAMRIRIEQATPIRAAVLTRDGLWHVGSSYIDAAGGGCTAPSVVRAEAGWEERLGQVLGKRFALASTDRLRLQIAHPMDNGLVGGIPEFYLNQAELRDEDGKVLATLELFPSVSENPTLSLEVQGEGETELWLRDNNGNEFKAVL
ncbi:MAG: quinoprotein dehydrogenase-associated SoxYZ-like carrier [Pseudomonas sp.]|uniref:quinoprotein dehydrogenase-associated SoxYZ-like carrier n=1 Tax=Pseudomonas sp. TaxID=306 RepID=UPI00299EB0BB|nr:quinoprotein dehydrogenase-associated SoxYZ-like carrier [Pseudomonas sp.]MDX1723245.1 quinoprotein dehydrogenase-associated SoxYZ-like carrier [Pseudomonas sp.]